ncbi:hypothetical protein [Streptomyces europaeiscabiei]
MEHAPETVGCAPVGTTAPETAASKAAPMWLLAGENEDGFDEPCVCRGID